MAYERDKRGNRSTMSSTERDFERFGMGKLESFGGEGPKTLEFGHIKWRTGKTSKERRGEGDR